MNKALQDRLKIAKKLQSDIGSIYDTINNIDINKFNNKSRFKWKVIYDGYSGNGRIFDSKYNYWKKKDYILIYNFEHIEDFIKIINNQDNRIFEAIQEAVFWVEGEIELIQSKTNDFAKAYYNTGQAVQETINIYTSLKRN